MSNSKLGRCDYCERQSVPIRIGWILDSETHEVIQAAIRQVCVDLEECRTSGGNPPDPELIKDLEN